MGIINNMKNIYRTISGMDIRLQKIQQTLGRIEARQNHSTTCFSENEFQVFSQWGEDGLIQYLIRSVPIEREIFVEFGVEKYVESNTRFLLINDNWSGLVIDGSSENIEFIKNDPIYWKHNLKADCSFITKDNINGLLAKNGISGDIGILSVDIDGNDYWVWQSINSISPRIVICEYNSLWGPDAMLTTPYSESFVRSSAHYSNLYYGASIAALTKLAEAKGYSLVGANAAGNNVFFVRNDVIGGLKIVKPCDAWRESKFRESRDTNGVLTYLPFGERISALSGMPIFDVASGEVRSINEVFDI